MFISSSEQINRLRHTADPSADAVAERIAATGIIKEVNISLSKWDRNDMAPPDDLPDFVRDWLMKNAVLPDWADPTVLARAHELFRHHGPMIGLVGLTASFAWMYACPYGAKIMAHSGRFTDQTDRRIAETIQYIFSVAEPGAFSPTGRGICTSVKVRLIHAIVRWFVRNRGDDTQDARTPISQLELISTAQCLGPKLIDDLRKLNVEITPVEADAWAHLWRVCGTLLGGDPANFPSNYADALAQVNQVLDEEKGPSEAGRRLTKQLLKFFANLLPGSTFDNIPAAVMRYLLDEERCEFIGVPKSRWESLFRSGWTGSVWTTGKSLPLLSSKTLERLALALIEGHFREVGGVPVKLELQSNVRTAFQRRALSVVEAYEKALADGELSGEDRATLADLQTQLKLSDTQLRQMAVVGALNAALQDGVLQPAEIELVNKFAERAGMTQEQRSELATAMSDGVLGARERAWLHEVLQIVG